MNRGNRHRLELLKQFDALYSHHYSERGLCFYCGDPGGCVDHVPPLSWVDAVQLESWRKYGIPLVKIQSCQDCNSRLTNKPFFTAVERLKFLDRRLSEVYEAKATLWSHDEIAEMSPMFQKMITGRQSKLMLLHARIKHIQWRAVHAETHPDES